MVVLILVYALEKIPRTIITRFSFSNLLSIVLVSVSDLNQNRDFGLTLY